MSIRDRIIATTLMYLFVGLTPITFWATVACIHERNMYCVGWWLACAALALSARDMGRLLK